MNLEAMKYETDGDLIRLTLDRPEVLNVVNYHRARRSYTKRPRRSTTTPTPEPRSSGAMGGLLYRHRPQVTVG
jgi:hypothetical protein